MPCPICGESCFKCPHTQTEMENAEAASERLVDEAVEEATLPLREALQRIREAGNNENRRVQWDQMVAAHALDSDIPEPEGGPPKDEIETLRLYAKRICVALRAANQCGTLTRMYGGKVLPAVDPWEIVANTLAALEKEIGA
jgi:hypothetical protein